MPRKPTGVYLKRAMRLRCPRCGEGPLFAGLFRMHTHCERCRLKYERAPGYFLGSTYINYGLTALVVTALYIGLHFGMNIDNGLLAFPLVAICIAIPVAFFRHSRALWLAMDICFDSTGFESDEG